MRTEKEIREQIKHLEQEQKKAFCKCQYAVFDRIDTEINTLKWVLAGNKVVNNIKTISK